MKRLFCVLIAVKQTLLNADSLIFNNVASGDYFAKVLERLGIAEAVKAKVIRLDPSVMNERVIQSKGNDIGVGVVPLINTTKGLRLLGPLPSGKPNQGTLWATPRTHPAFPDSFRSCSQDLAG